ncbi:BlaI/MecI/CopY family transcriptional regulator [Ralstonia insidiosa]|jgi:predicted transcriptional regulator|uniref:BlaI/MecI/CopY family transcriptional regulator n=1 Tax=Ralstonia insidiosa TaxID=190721 RepID=A0A191ZSL8_9RALS|nr:BlaI/MecI/CopY family transcriptional regulator [Ralstonia insidiosa]ANJ71093.1 BlaI/MecI/CopY family transcriptional regulator [Ralstonia insidiosa]KAB0471673.1 BlaI/MecI/CopY family transcriptional regulator [Ralstonia insidiosa]MBY4908774.1 BlaI/MecI/CopY family transcriptional regulator [Ralstonia insidiosa]
MTKTSPRIKPTAAELNLLRVLWQLGPATVKQVHQAVLVEKPETTYAAVLRQLQIMHAKGMLVRDERERSHVYAPAQRQNVLQSGLLNEFINKAFAGSGKALVLAALRGHVTKEERAEIEALLREEDL